MTLTRCDNCGRYGWHSTDRCPEPATVPLFERGVSTTMDTLSSSSRRIELEDTLRRIRNIVDAYPQDGWTLGEAKAVHAVLSGMVRVRRGDGALRVTVTIASQSGGPDVEVSTRLPNPPAELDQLADHQ